MKGKNGYFTHFQDVHPFKAIVQAFKKWLF